jgi:hypothetical protein
MSPDLALLLLAVAVLADLVLSAYHALRPGARSVIW